MGYSNELASSPSSTASGPPSFHMEGGLGSCKLMGLFYRKKIVDDAPQSPLSLKEGGPRQRWVIAGGSI